MAADYLYQTVHPITGAVTTYQPFDGEFDLSFDRQDATYTLLGADGGLDPLGKQAFQIAPRKIGVKFRLPYNASTYTDSTTARDALMKAYGHGRYQQLIWKTASGAFRYSYGKAIHIPFKATVDTPFFCEFAVTFTQQNPYWEDSAPGGWKLWDDPAHHWDDLGLLWDDNTAVDFPVTLTNQQTTLTNGGTAAQYDVVHTISGPITGPFVIYNLSIPIGSGGNTKTYMYMAVSASLAANERIVLDSARQSVTKVDQSGNVSSLYPQFSYGNSYGQTEWFRLDPGTNVLQLSMTGAPGAGARWSIVYKTAYL